MRSIWLWPAIIVVSSLGVSLMVFRDIASPLRSLTGFWFLFICPGMALVPLLRIKDRLTELILAIALSLALDMIVAEAVLYAGMWSSKVTLAVLICISLAGVALQLAISRSHVSGKPQPL